jgi:hypothetical protein
MSKATGRVLRQSKFSLFMARHGVRYSWRGYWPPIPVPLNPFDFDPREQPDARPKWVEKIQERLLEKILPLKKGMSLEFYLAALLGYAFASCDRERTERLDASKRMLADSEAKLVQEELAKVLGAACDAFKEQRMVPDHQPVPEAADRMKGYAYGIQCQHREAGWQPSATTQALHIQKALLLNWRKIKFLTDKGATAREIGEYVVERTVMSAGMTYAQYFKSNPRAAEDSKATFLKYLETIFQRLKIPLPRRGRPNKIPTRNNSAAGIKHPAHGLALCRAKQWYCVQRRQRESNAL